MAKKLFFFLSLLLCCVVSVSAGAFKLQGDAFETEFSFIVEKPLENKIYPLLRACSRKTVLGIVLRQYPDQKEILFNTVRLQENGKFFVLEFRHDFPVGKKNNIKLVYSSGTAALYLDGKLMKSRSYTGKFVPGTLENNSRTPVRAIISKVSGDVESCSVPKTAFPWKIEGSGLSVKDLGGGKYLLDYDGKGKKAVLWSTSKCFTAGKGEHIRASGKYTILKSEYGSMFRFKINSLPQIPVLTMSGDRYQRPFTQTKKTGTPERFDFSIRGNMGEPYAFNIEFYGNPQRWILEDFSIKNMKIVRAGRPPVQSENRKYDLQKVRASLQKLKPVSYKLKNSAGRVVLQLDGKDVSPVIYRRGPHYPFWTRYANFRDAGIDLCYFFAMLAPPSVNHKMGVAGMWLGRGKYDFSKMDEELRVIHAINPRARVILALCLGVYENWDKDHPDSVMCGWRKKTL